VFGHHVAWSVDEAAVGLADCGSSKSCQANNMTIKLQKMKTPKNCLKSFPNLHGLGCGLGILFDLLGLQWTKH